MISGIRNRMIASATGPFAHAPYPLARTLDYAGDPGLFGPGSVSWRVIGDVSTMVAGIRALLIQSAHPEVVAGVYDHSRYQDDPFGRLSRTSAYVTATTFGAIPEVEEAARRVRRVHRPIKGESHRGEPYDADASDLSAWVHNALTDSFLQAYQHYGPSPLTAAEADSFVAEQAEIGRLLDADPVPETASELADWIATHPGIGPSPGMAETVMFLTNPPLEGPGQVAGYKVMYSGAVATIPPRVRDVLRVESFPGSIRATRLAVATLRWALGSSPSWHLALLRVGAEVPQGLFRQPLPVEGAEAATDLV